VRRFCAPCSRTHLSLSRMRNSWVVASANLASCVACLWLWPFGRRVVDSHQEVPGARET
jgi:hypothetical protein